MSGAVAGVNKTQMAFRVKEHFNKIKLAGLLNSH